MAARVNLGRNLSISREICRPLRNNFSGFWNGEKTSAALFYLGLVYLIQGQETAAEETFTRAMAEFGPAEGVRVGVVSCAGHDTQAETGRPICP